MGCFGSMAAKTRAEQDLQDLLGSMDCWDAKAVKTQAEQGRLDCLGCLDSTAATKQVVLDSIYCLDQTVITMPTEPDLQDFDGLFGDSENGD